MKHAALDDVAKHRASAGRKSGSRTWLDIPYTAIQCWGQLGGAYKLLGKLPGARDWWWWYALGIPYLSVTQTEKAPGLIEGLRWKQEIQEHCSCAGSPRQNAMQVGDVCEVSPAA